MIESVYAGTTEKQAEYQVSGRRPPKNVRQAGYFTGDFRIYIEDYVHTFTHWLAEQDHSARCVAVLVGEFAKSEHSREVYAYGAVVAENAWLEGRIEMTSEIWKQVYETIKEYFPDGEIVGWFYGGTSFTDKEREQLRQVHLDYFAGTDRILMLYDFLEREEEFFRYENDEMSQQTGFYIYYEKNAEMQSYMIDKKQGRDFREQVEDRAVREMRNRLAVSMSPGEDTEENPEAAEQEKDQGTSAEPGSRFLYAAGVVLAAIAVVMGASLIYNQERLKGFEQTLNQILGAADGKKNVDGQDGGKQEGLQADDGQGNIFDDPRIQETFGPQGGNAGNDISELTGTAAPAKEDGQNNKDTDADPSGGGSADGKNAGGDKQAGDKTDQDQSGGNGKNGPDQETANGATAAVSAGPTPSGGPEGPGNSQIPSDMEQEPVMHEGDVAETSITPQPQPTEPEKEASGQVIDPSKYTLYIVQPGDTLVGICMRRYGNLDNLEFIKGLNQINNENLIFAYQELLVP